MADALTQQGNQVNGVAAQMNGQGPVSTLPTAAATLTPGSRSGTQPHKSASTAPAKAPAAARREPKQTPMVPSAGRQRAESDLERSNAVRFCTLRGRGQRSGNDSICTGRLLHATVKQRFAAGYA